MRLVVAGPALAGIGALLGRRAPRRLGGLLALGSALAVGDIAARPVVPGANDNLAAVAVLVELARLLGEARPAGVRVLLLSTGGEESFMEGMRGFVARHAGALTALARASWCWSASGAARRSCWRARACCGCATTRRRCATGWPGAASGPGTRCGAGCAPASPPTR